MREQINYRSTNISKVAVIGAGLIGASWAAYFLKHGLDVSVYDPITNAEDDFYKTLQKALEDLARLGSEQPTPAGKISFTNNLEEALTDCDYVQENGPEHIDIKQQLLHEVDQLSATDILIGSSTSSFICSDLQATCADPHRIIVAHPFNPPHLIPLVELGAGKQTSLAAIDAAYNFFTQIGKSPIKIKKEAVGHVANRLTAALWQEAVHIVAEGIASVSDVDRAICDGPGLRWAVNGPHMLYHLGGGKGGIKSYLEHLGPAQEARWKTLGKPVLDQETCQKIIEGVIEEAGDLKIEQLANIRDEKLIEILKVLTSKKGQRL